MQPEKTPNSFEQSPISHTQRAAIEQVLQRPRGIEALKMGESVRAQPAANDDTFNLGIHAEAAAATGYDLRLSDASLGGKSHATAAAARDPQFSAAVADRLLAA